MSARDTTERRRTTLVRAGGLLVALLAAVGLVLLPVPAGGEARAATGSSDSAVTKSGTKGPLDDFSKLKVTVDQTKDLNAQAVRVTWTGGAPTIPNVPGTYHANFLQIMECWGNSPDGPDRDQCEWGQPPQSIGTNALGRVIARTPSSDDHLDDPAETVPATPGGQYLPMRTASGQTTTDVSTYFSPLTTNEQPVTRTGSDGTGESIFQLESGATADYTGCGTVASPGAQAQPCWLVVVPRGTHEPDGAEVSATDNNGLRTSPLSASNWAQRIAFRLDFKPIGVYCKIGQKEQPTIGSEMVQEAITSWQPTLCTSENVHFDYLGQSSDFIRQQVLAGGQNGQLGFVQDPVVPPDGSPPVVHAPVAVSGLAIGYNIQVLASARQVPRLRLNARLIAKMLTESYQCDLPGPNSQVVRGKLSEANAQRLMTDPEFLKINPGFTGNDVVGCRADLQVPQGQSDYAGALWRWLRSDPAAKSFLDGKPDEWGMTVNPAFHSAEPDVSSLNEFPKPDPTTYVQYPQYPNLSLNAVTINPYGSDLHDDATRVRSGNNKGSWWVDTNSVGGPALGQSPQLPGVNFMLGLTDTATAARYRLGTAELLNADGQYVAPTDDALTKTVAGMKDGSVPGVLDQDPGLKIPGAYPLTTVTYAAASTGLGAASRSDYATLIRYAAGVGQQSGIGNGLLPPGYAPLPAKLHDQALAAATQLVAGAPASSGGTSAGSGDTTGTSGGLSTGGSSGSLTGGGTSAGSTGSAGGTAAGATGGATPTSSATAAAAAGGTSTSGGSPGGHNVAETGSKTPGLLLGAVRWVLLVVLIVGIAGSLAGPLLLRAGVIRAGGGAMFPFRKFSRGSA